MGGEDVVFAPYLEILWTFLKAFLVGGGICMIAQIVINFTDLTAGKILVVFMLSGVVLQGLGLYQYLVDFAGAGATVPISGFGYLLANGALKGAEKGFFGAFTGALASASAGVSAAVIFSFIIAMIFKSRTKKN
ncbi:MAG: stage V sporulation protein AE [Clostridia bacterium]|nr:stage V sporulation protein AE [Clostridia bacterium]